MRRKVSACVLFVLALLIPVSPAAAQPASPELTELTEAACQIDSFTDIRKLVTIDLDTASDAEVRVLAFQILGVTQNESLRSLNAAMQERLGGTMADLRTFLKSDYQAAWSTDLRFEVFRTLSGAGANVQAAAGEALTNDTVDALLTYLNNGLYVARALDAGWSLKVFTDIRKLVTIDLDTASDAEVRVLAFQILGVTQNESLRSLNAAMQERLGGTMADLRTFLKSDYQAAWSTDLRFEVFRTLSGAGANVQAAAGEALTNDTVDALLTYLNNGLYVARALDACESSA